MADADSGEGMNNVERGADDFRFCYAGVQGSGTSLHRDGELRGSLRRNER